MIAHYRVLGRPSLALVLLLAGSVTGGEADLYVSVDGTDSWSGRLAEPNDERTDGPLRTLTAARNQIRPQLAGMSRDLVVMVRGGRYRLDGPLTLTPAGSGQNGFRVIYRNYRCERPVLVGSKRVTGWQKCEGRMWKAEVGKGTTFHTLYEGGRRARKARHPNYVCHPNFPAAAGEYVVSEDGSPELEKGVRESWLIYRTDDAPPTGSDVRQMKINVFPWGKCDWHRWICKVTKVDPTARRVTFDNQADKTRIGDRARYFLEDEFAFVDAPGEFFLDEEQGVLYYLPMGQGSPEDLDVTMPVVRDLIRIQGGSRDDRVHHIRIEGLAFEETDGISPTRFWWQFQWGRTGHALVWMRHTDHIEIRNCHLKNSGRNGVMMIGHCTHNVVSGCWIEQMGVNGITLSCRFSNDQRNGPTEDRLEHNVLTNNKIHDVGQLSIYNACINLMSGSHNEVSCSEFFNSPRYATTMRGNTNSQKGVVPGWNRRVPPAHNNVFKYLRIYDCGQDSGDMGAVHACTINIKGGPHVNRWEQITIGNSRAVPGMADWPPDGIFVDWPSRTMHQVFRNVKVSNSQGEAFRSNGSDNEASAVFENVSWRPGFKESGMTYEEIGLKPDFPAEYGGARRVQATPTCPRKLAAEVVDHATIGLSWERATEELDTSLLYVLFRNNEEIAATPVCSFRDCDLSERTVYQYRLVAKHAPFGPLGKRGAQVSVRTPEDRTPPTIASVWAHDALTRVVVTFTEPVERSAAEVAANYRIEPGCTVEGAQLLADPSSVALGVSALSSGKRYTLKVSNITDCAVSRNLVSVDSKAAFEAMRPVLRYPMDAVDGHKILDVSGHGRHGELMGGCKLEPEGGRHGGALRLNGRDAWVQCPADVNLGRGDFTLMSWLWRQALGSRIILAKGNGFNTPGEWSWGWEHPTNARNVSFRSKNQYSPTAPQSMSHKRWIHVAFVRRGNTGQAYVNGEPSGGPHDLSALGDLSNDKPLMIGRREYVRNPAWFWGAINDVRIYDRALDEATIRAYVRTGGALSSDDRYLGH